MIKNKFAKWIEWLLDLLPLFAVLFMCLYVTFNPNAKDSYSGLNENTQENVIVNTLDDFDFTKTYYIGSSSLDENSSSGRTTSNLNVNNFTVIYQPSTSNIPNDIVKIYFYVNSGQNLINYYFFDTNNTQYYLSSNNTFLFSCNIHSFTSTVNNQGNLDYVLQHSELLYYIEYFNYQQLDNNFEYSLSKFNDLGFDRLNFVNWFTGLFLNGTSNVYTTFINGYLNYFLLVECTYVLPMVLYWFIHLGERLISKLEYGGDK